MCLNLKEVTITKKKSPQAKEKARWYNIKRLYGITQDEYQILLEEQDHSCGICKRDQSTFSTALHVDHDHKTLEIRGLLCHFCNSRFLGRHSNAELFRAAADYLEKPRRGWLTPKKKPVRRKKRQRIRKNSRQVLAEVSEDLE